jgi:hypothetical protein
MKPAIKQLMRNWHAEYGISYRTYHSVAVLGTAVEKWGVQATRVSPLENRRPGIVLGDGRKRMGVCLASGERRDGPWPSPAERVQREALCGVGRCRR